VRRKSHKEAHLLPCGDLFVGPNAGGVKAVARSFVGNKSRFADDQRSRYARTRGIVLDDEICGRVFAVRPESGQGCHNYSVLEGDGADLNGLKKLGCGHCNASVGLFPHKALFYEAVARDR
jgi:hypothetical protein